MFHGSACPGLGADASRSRGLRKPWLPPVRLLLPRCGFDRRWARTANAHPATPISSIRSRSLAFTAASAKALRTIVTGSALQANLSRCSLCMGDGLVVLVNARAEIIARSQRLSERSADTRELQARCMRRCKKRDVCETFSADRRHAPSGHVSADVSLRLSSVCSTLNI